MQLLTFAPALLAAGSALAANIQVIVGNSSTLTFSPSSVTAQVGDTIDFVFVAGNHSVTQSTFANPCTSNGGLDSGFQAIPQGATNAQQFSVNVTDTSAPLWFFCAQTAPKNHCQNGMVFAVNPTAEKSFDAFQAAAKNAATTNSTAAPSGSASAAPSDSAAASASATSGATSPSGSAVSGSASSSGSSPSSSAAAAANGAASVKVGTTAGLIFAGLAAGLLL